MASHEVRIKRLERQVLGLKDSLAAQKAEIAALKKCCKKIEKWGLAESDWSMEVTDMLREIDWADLAAHFGCGGGTNPPQTPPDWPT